jgi:hypothetical protein
MSDVYFNILTGFGLLAIAARCVIAIDNDAYSRAAFCFFFMLAVLRTAVQRWFSGITNSERIPDRTVTNFLADPLIVNPLFTLLFAALAWVTFDEFMDARRRRRALKLAENRKN